MGIGLVKREMKKKKPQNQIKLKTLKVVILSSFDCLSYFFVLNVKYFTFFVLHKKRRPRHPPLSPRSCYGPAFYNQRKAYMGNILLTAVWVISGFSFSRNDKESCTYTGNTYRGNAHFQLVPK